MPGLFPRLSERGRRAWVLAAVVAGFLGITLAAVRHDYPMAAVTALALAVLVAVYLWGRRGGE